MDGIARLAQHPAYRSTRRVGPAAGQGEQGVRWLWVVAETDCLLERFLGCVVRTADAQQLTLLRERQARGGRGARRNVARDGAVELGDGLLEGPTDPHHLAAVNRALTGERHQSHLGPAPGGQRRRPLRHPVEIRDLLTGLDQGTVGVPGEDGRHLARGHADHGLVEQSHALGHPTQVEQAPSLRHQSRGEQVSVSEAPAVRREGGGLVQSGDRVAAEDVAEHPEEEDVPVLDGVLLQGLEKTVGTRDPATRDRVLTPVHQRHRQPEGGPDRGMLVTGFEVSLVRPLEGLDAVVVTADEERSGGEIGEVGGQERIAPGRRKTLVGGNPVATIERLTRPEQFFDDVHDASPRSEHKAVRQPGAASPAPSPGCRSGAPGTPRPGRCRGRPSS